jgi:H+/Cl- antiporter ClcA
LDVVGDRALLAAVAYFIAAYLTTFAAPVVVAELTESVNGCWIDATVFE